MTTPQPQPQAAQSFAAPAAASAAPGSAPTAAPAPAPGAPAAPTAVVGSAPARIIDQIAREWEFEPGVAPIDKQLPAHLQPFYDQFEKIVQAVRQSHPEAGDVQFVGDGEMWVNANGEDRRTDVRVPNDMILMWAKIFGRGGRGDEVLRHGAEGTVENAVNVAGVRLRMTFRRQMGGFGLNFRILPPTPPTLADGKFTLNPIPQTLVDLVLGSSDGLILFEGPTGSGKSTMQAALVNEVNTRQHRHIYTLEDPIEFVHNSHLSLITQREVGTHVDSFEQGMKTAKRSKPSIILLGELRDKDTKRAALESAGEGHLVMATSHASAVPEAVAGFIGSFPGEEQNEVRQNLATTLKAVVVQVLVPTLNGGLVAAREMVTIDPTIAAQIREGATGDKLRTALMSSANRDKPGTFSRDDDLFNLTRNRIIGPDVALRYAIDAKSLEQKLISQGVTSLAELNHLGVGAHRDHQVAGRRRL